MTSKQEIKEIITEGDKKFREMTMVLNTQEGTNQFTTDNINGILKSIILSNEGKVEVQIMSEKGYSIYHEIEHAGTHYFPIKVAALNRNAHKLNFEADDFYLNERLVVTVVGPKNIDVSIIMRIV